MTREEEYNLNIDKDENLLESDKESKKQYFYDAAEKLLKQIDDYKNDLIENYSKINISCIVIL